MLVGQQSPENRGETRRVDVARVSKARRAECIEQLRKEISPGDTIYTTIKHVSRSGMMRSIDVHTIRDNEPRWIARYVADALGQTFDEKHEAVKMSGAGMDMGFALVYELSHALFSDGFVCIGEGCRSNDHSNGDRDYTPHAHSDPGYALNQLWL